MRPPRESWRLCADAIQKLDVVVQVIRRSTEVNLLMFTVPGAMEKIDQMYKDAHDAAERLRAFVEESEECEQP